jgi:hypothetical protein
MARVHDHTTHPPLELGSLPFPSSTTMVATLDCRMVQEDGTHGNNKGFHFKNKTKGIVSDR